MRQILRNFSFWKPDRLEKQLTTIGSNTCRKGEDPVNEFEMRCQQWHLVNFIKKKSLFSARPACWLHLWMDNRTCELSLAKHPWGKKSIYHGHFFSEAAIEARSLFSLFLYKAATPKRKRKIIISLAKARKEPGGGSIYEQLKSSNLNLATKSVSTFWLDNVLNLQPC